MAEFSKIIELDLIEPDCPDNGEYRLSFDIIVNGQPEEIFSQIFDLCQDTYDDIVNYVIANWDNELVSVRKTNGHLEFFSETGGVVISQGRVGKGLKTYPLEGCQEEGEHAFVTISNVSQDSENIELLFLYIAINIGHSSVLGGISNFLVITDNNPGNILFIDMMRTIMNFINSQTHGELSYYEMQEIDNGDNTSNFIVTSKDYASSNGYLLHIEISWYRVHGEGDPYEYQTYTSVLSGGINPCCIEDGKDAYVQISFNYGESPGNPDQEIEVPTLEYKLCGETIAIIDGMIGSRLDVYTHLVNSFNSQQTTFTAVLIEPTFETPWFSILLNMPLDYNGCALTSEPYATPD
jgi:hypothetical protein